MSDKQKERKNKDNKNKRSASSFFSNLNTDSSIEYGYAEKNPKSKWAKWTIAGAVLAVTTVGIAVPWSLSSCTVALNRPYASGEVLYTYKDPITNQQVEVTYQEFEETLKDSTTNYLLYNTGLIPDVGGSYKVMASQLTSEGYLDNLTDPQDNVSPS